MESKNTLQLERPICFFDLETTGVDTQNDRIIEISICKVFPNGERITKTQRVNPGIPIPAEASEVHKIYDVDVESEPSFKSYAKGIYQFIKDSDIAGFNSNKFDAPMLLAEFTRANVDWDITNHKFIDVGNIFKIKEPRTLVQAAKYYLDLDITEVAHSAEVDTTATADIFFEMFKKYDDMPTDINSLAILSNYDKELIDLSGWFVQGAEKGDIIFNIGKHKGKNIKNHLDYLDWMVKQESIPKDTKDICRKFLKPKIPTNNL